jgi:hypothetical protein
LHDGGGGLTGAGLHLHDGGGGLSGAGLPDGVSVLRVQTVTQVRVHSEEGRILHVKYRGIRIG